jgi:phospholipid:diacylglycerol acyltransferase
MVSKTRHSTTNQESQAQDEGYSSHKRRNKRHPRSNHRSGGGRGGGGKKKMITHRTADDLSQAVPTESSVPLVRRADNSMEDEDETTKSTCWKPTGKLVLFSVIVWLAQVVISVALKKYGWIEQDLNEIVASRVLPELQHHLEHSFDSFTSTWSPFNESAYNWLRLNENISIGHITQERKRPGFQLAKEGAHGSHPVIMIPGFVTSGLEVWEAKDCAKRYFRQRMWGGISSARQFLMEKDCILQHLALDPKSGGDPENIRLRAAQGFEAADYFMANYWVWGKILENLADVGYDGGTMSMEAYDWRLAFPLLEQRDGYLTKLKYRIESFHKASGKKVIISSHSLGGILVHYFMTWVTTNERDGGGGGGKDWVDKHIHAYINIAGAHLGVPKAASALLSGEMRDTIIMGAVGSLVEQWIGRKLRRDLWSSWGSLWCMLPKGGDALWNDGKEVSPLLVLTDSPNETTKKELDELTCATEHVIHHETELKVNEALKTFSSRKVQSVQHTIDFLLHWGAGLGPSLSASKLHDFDRSSKPSKHTWHDVSRTPLPHAPNMKIYCMYGVGLDTEQSYYYKRNMAEGQQVVDNQSLSPKTNQVQDPPFVLDTSIEDAENNVIHGVKYTDGDASVPLLSLGYMCADAWQRTDSGLNPSKTKVITREYKHRQEFSVDDPMRSGPYSADHVDILGNVDMMEDFIKIVTGHDTDSVQTNIVSDIENMAKKINSNPNGGLFKRRRWTFRQ